MDYKNLSQEYIDNHISKLSDILDTIEPYKVTILTGGNASGKSLIRKQLIFRLIEKLTALGIKDINKTSLIKSVSMQRRTESVPEWSALSTCLHDLPTTATSVSTYSLIKAMFTINKASYFIIDEPEIGMSEEAQLGLSIYLNNKIENDIRKNHYGILIITHSKTIVRNIKHDAFINIDGLTEGQWLHREIKPIDLEELDKWSRSLFKTLRDRERNIRNGNNEGNKNQR